MILSPANVWKRYSSDFAKNEPSEVLPKNSLAAPEGAPRMMKACAAHM